MPRRERVRKLLHYGGPLAWAAAFAWQSAVHGLPLGRDRVLLWIVLALVAFSLTDLRRLGRGIIVDWLPFVLVLFAYDLLRGYADGLLFHSWTTPQITVEKALFAGAVPTVWLQAHLWHGWRDVRWYDYASWLVYLTHFFATLVVATALWLFRPARFRRYIVMVCALSALAFLTYVLYPAVPPWMASERGYIGPAVRTIRLIWGHISIAHFRALFEKGTRYTNNVAAMPSLHAAYALLITMYFWRVSRWWWRILLAAYPFAMGFALVYTAEHYVVDILAGWVYAIVVFFAVELGAAWLAARRRRATKIDLAWTPTSSTPSAARSGSGTAR